MHTNTILTNFYYVLIMQIMNVMKMRFRSKTMYIIIQYTLHVIIYYNINSASKFYTSNN